MNSNPFLGHQFRISAFTSEVTNRVQFDIDHEILFHGKLYEITGNQTLKNFQNLLLPLFNYVYDSGLINTTSRSQRHVTHQQIVELLRAGKARDLRQGIRMHLENHYRRIFKSR